MAKRSWHEAVINGLAHYVNRNNYAYFYGAKGQRLTNATMDALIAAEPAYFKKYSAAEMAQIRKNSLNKIGYDCSGFVGWVCTGDKQYSAGQAANGIKNGSIAGGVAGSLLFKSAGGRHIGLDIGYGFQLDMAMESTDWAVATGNDSIRLKRIKDSGIKWEASVRSNVLDYTGADAR